MHFKDFIQAYRIDLKIEIQIKEIIHFTNYKYEIRKNKYRQAREIRSVPKGRYFKKPAAVREYYEW